MSRTCGGEIWFDDVEPSEIDHAQHDPKGERGGVHQKEALRRVIWRIAEFSVMRYCEGDREFVEGIFEA
jgi:hypothetical protein